MEKRGCFIEDNLILTNDKGWIYSTMSSTFLLLPSWSTVEKRGRRQEVLKGK